MAVQVAFTTGAPTASPTVAVNLVQPGLVKVLADSFTLGAPDWQGDPLTGLGVLGTRQVEMTVQVTGTYQQAAALAQQIARTLAQSRPTWLMYRWSQADDPMFALVYPSQTQPLEWRSGGVEVWNLPITLTCGPALYGPVESGAVTVNNDPAAGSNPCFWNIGSSVKGDLETPLFITTGAQTDVSGRTLLTASSALRYGLTQTTPFIVQLNAASITAGAGFTTGAGDAAMSGGNYYRYTSTGAGAQTSTLLWNAGNRVMASTPIGDYRVLLRYRTSTPGDAFQVNLTQFDDVATSPVVGDRGSTLSAGDAAWMDLGVFRFPLGSSAVDTAFGTTPASVGNRIQLTLTVPAGGAVGHTFDFDCLMFVPAGLDQAASNRMAIVKPSPTLGSTSMQIALDSVNDDAYVLNSSGQVGGLGFSSFVGGLPTVVPGCHNSLTWIRQMAAVASVVTDSITATTVLNWQYWPRYLHMRPTGS